MPLDTDVDRHHLPRVTTHDTLNAEFLSELERDEAAHPSDEPPGSERDLLDTIALFLRLGGSSRLS